MENFIRYSPNLLEIIREYAESAYSQHILEINLEAPADIAEEIAKVVYDCMVNAGKIFCTRCKLDADISRNKDGSLPTHWVH